ncbi:hypothetical protein Tco_0140132 [Tanacetum coccineum]
MIYFQDEKWYENLMDDKPKQEALKQKAINEESWDEEPKSVKEFYVGLKIYFGDFHELDYELMVKLQDYLWKKNDNESSPLSKWKDHVYGIITSSRRYDPFHEISKVLEDHASIEKEPKDDKFTNDYLA